MRITRRYRRFTWRRCEGVPDQYVMRRGVGSLKIRLAFPRMVEESLPIGFVENCGDSTTAADKLGIRDLFATWRRPGGFEASSRVA